MPRLLTNQIEVHLFRRKRIRTEFLCLRRTPVRETLPGVWQPVTGGIRPRESALAAAAREVREETGLVPVRWWALENVNVYFDARRDAIVLLPVFAAEVGRDDDVRLSDEHDAFAWLPDRAAGARYLWEAQRVALAAVRRLVVRPGRLARALEIDAARIRRRR